MSVTLVPVRGLDLTASKYTRAGVLPMSGSNPTLFWFAVDGETYELTDFGGGRDILDRDILDTALREYREESFGVFGALTRSQAYQLKALVRDNNVLLLYPLEEAGDKFLFSPEHYIRRIKGLIGDNLYFETQAIVCLDLRQIESLLDMTRLEGTLINPHLASLLSKWRQGSKERDWLGV